MVDKNAEQATRVVPLMRYRDLPNAITWLADAFGFDAHYTASDDDGKLIYAQMTYGHGMVMLGPVRDSDFDDLLSQPDEIGGTETQSCYLVVEDIESHYQRAKEAGAEIALDVQSDETGGRAYSCRDCEGHLWNFGTFDPWQSTRTGSRALTTVAQRVPVGPVSMVRSAAAVFAGVAIAGVAIGVYTHHKKPQDQLSNIRIVEPDDAQSKPRAGLPTAPVRVVAALRNELKRERLDRRKAEQNLALVKKELTLEKSRSQDAVRATRRVSEELEAARGAERAALTTVERLRAQHIKDLKLANASVEDLQKAIADERAAKKQALQNAEDLKVALVLERERRAAAEQRAVANSKTSESVKTARRPVTSVEPAKSKAEPKRATTKLPEETRAKSENPKQKKTISAVAPPRPEETAQPEASAPKKVAPTKQKSQVKRKPRRKRVVKSAPKKKPVKKRTQPTNALSRGWPHNTW